MHGVIKGYNDSTYYMPDLYSLFCCYCCCFARFIFLSYRCLTLHWVDGWMDGWMSR